MSIIQIATPFNIDLEFEIAEFHKRLFAYAIDFTILIIYAVILKYFLFENVSDLEDNMGLAMLVISLPTLLYPLIVEILMKGQSIGKKILGIRIISLTGGEPELGQYLMRWVTRFWEWPFLFGYIVYHFVPLLTFIFVTGIFGVSVVIIIAVSKNSQRLGDMGAGTVVVNTKSDLSIHDTVFMQVTKQDYKVMFPGVMRLSDRDINTIKNVVTQAQRKGNFDMCNRVAMRVKDVLQINTDLYPADFLEKLLEDYNYLATRE
ncbi:MAG: RDD family protein [Ferruginibacter sp.]